MVTPCGFESHLSHQKKPRAIGSGLFLVCEAGLERAAERSEVKKCPGDTFLARGRVPGKRMAIPKDRQAVSGNRYSPFRCNPPKSELDHSPSQGRIAIRPKNTPIMRAIHESPLRCYYKTVRKIGICLRIYIVGGGALDTPFS